MGLLLSKISGKSGRISERWRVHLIVATLALGWAVLYVDRSILFPLLPVGVGIVAAIIPGETATGIVESSDPKPSPVSQDLARG